MYEFMVRTSSTKQILNGISQVEKISFTKADRDNISKNTTKGSWSWNGKKIERKK